MAGEYRRFQGDLFDAGYAGINFPKRYGGAEGNVMENIIVSELTGPVYFHAMGGNHVISLGLAAPTILAWGNEAQKQEFLPKTLSGQIIWSQGFSEPNAGSDLANLGTRAVKEGDEYIVSDPVFDHIERIKTADLKKAPKSFKSAPAVGKQFKGMKCTIQVSTQDCVGCTMCFQVCPARKKGKNGKPTDVYIEPQDDQIYTDIPNLLQGLDETKEEKIESIQTQ